MNRQEIEEVENGILCYLTQYPDEFRSVVSIYNNYDKDMPISKLPNKKLFKTICELLDSGHDNIVKTHDGGMCYLCFTTDSSNPKGLLEGLLTKSEQLENEDEFKKIDQCCVIEYWINNPNVSPLFDFTEYFDGENTVLHILSKKHLEQIGVGALQSADRSSRRRPPAPWPCRVPPEPASPSA